MDPPGRVRGGSTTFHRAAPPPRPQPGPDGFRRPANPSRIGGAAPGLPPMVTVLVNGLPASGKTTLARALAAELGLPLFSKDSVKETPADALGGVRSAELTAADWSRALGAAAGETLWTLLGEARGHAVLESPWPAHLRPVVAAGLARAGVGTSHEVWCDTPLETARLRLAARAAGRHPVHIDTDDPDDPRWDFWGRVAEPLGLGTPHRVDTTRPVDVRALAARIRGGRPGRPGGERPGTARW